MRIMALTLPPQSPLHPPVLLRLLLLHFTHISLPPLPLPPTPWRTQSMLPFLLHSFSPLLPLYFLYLFLCLHIQRHYPLFLLPSSTPSFLPFFLLSLLLLPLPPLFLLPPPLVFTSLPHPLPLSPPLPTALSSALRGYFKGIFIYQGDTSIDATLLMGSFMDNGSPRRFDILKPFLFLFFSKGLSHNIMVMGPKPWVSFNKLS